MNNAINVGDPVKWMNMGLIYRGYVAKLEAGGAVIHMCDDAGALARTVFITAKLTRWTR